MTNIIDDGTKQLVSIQETGGKPFAQLKGWNIPPNGITTAPYTLTYLVENTGAGGKIFAQLFIDGVEIPESYWKLVRDPGHIEDCSYTINNMPPGQHEIEIKVGHEE